MAGPLILVEAQPRNVADGTPVTVRFAGGGGARPYYYAGDHWQAGIVGLPPIVASLDFNEGDLASGGIASAAAIEWAPGVAAKLATAAGYVWSDAQITLRIGPEDGNQPPIVLVGRVMQASVRAGRLQLALADPAVALKKPFPVDRFDGSGGLEGPVEFDGRIKRRVFGRVWNLPGTPIDPPNNIYCFADPARPLQAFVELRDKGAATASLDVLAWQGSAATTFAALQAAEAPQGGGVACPSIGCVKWWTQPKGDLTADIEGEIGTGYVETTAQIVERIVGEIDGPGFAVGTIAAATAAHPAPVGWVVDDESTTVTRMLDELLGNVSLLWVLSPAGEIVVREWAWGASTRTVKAISIERSKTLRPVAKVDLGYRRNELPMARNSLAAIVLVEDLDVAPEDVLNSQQEWDDVQDSSGTKPADNATRNTGALNADGLESIALIDPRITGKSLANLDGAASTKLGGIATGATKNTGALNADGLDSIALTDARITGKSLANLDATAATKLTGIEANATASENLITNGAFASLDSSGLPTGYSLLGFPSTGTPLWSMGIAPSGEPWKRYFEVASGTGNYFLVLPRAGTLPVPVSGKLRFTGQMWAEDVYSGTCRLLAALRWSDNQGGFLNQAIIAYQHSAANTVEAFSIEAAPPEGAAFVEIRVQFKTTSGKVRAGLFRVSSLEEGSTDGAVAGENIKRSDGAIASDADITVPGLSSTGQLTVGAVNYGSVTAPGLGVKALGFLDTIALTDAKITSKSLANLDATANTKLTGIEAGATAGAAWGTNVTGRPTELTDGRVSAGLDASGDVKRNLPTVIKSNITADQISDGATYKRFLDTERTKLTGVETGATVGGKLGVNIKKADNSVATEAEILTSLGTANDVTNVSGVAAATVKNNAARAALGLDASGDVARPLPTSIKTAISADDISDGTTYKRYQAAERTKLTGIEPGAQVNPANLAALDSTANTKLAGIAAGATVGADWSTNLSNRPTSLTDGRVAAGLAANGDLARNLPTAIKSNITTDQISDGTSFKRFAAAEQTKLSGVATGATKNTVTRATTAPASPTDGDIWVDTSVTPNVIKTRVSGAWQISANYSTNTNQLTDGANLGGTATWSGVTGTGKPADNATVGAAWGTNLTGRPTELTDGRVASGLAANGDVNRAIPASIKASSDILSRAGGGTFTGALDSDKAAGAGLAFVDATANTKLSGIQAGAQVNPANLAALDAAASTKLAGIATGADVTADQPIVSKLDETTGRGDGRLVSANLNYGVRSLIVPPTLGWASGGVEGIAVSIYGGSLRSPWGTTYTLPDAYYNFLAASTDYYLVRHITNPESNGDSYSLETDPTLVNGSTKVLIMKITTPAAPGPGSSARVSGTIGSNWIP